MNRQMLGLVGIDINEVSQRPSLGNAIIPYRPENTASHPCSLLKNSHRITHNQPDSFVVPFAAAPLAEPPSALPICLPRSVGVALVSDSG
jgi:hypothetical protein